MLVVVGLGAIAGYFLIKSGAGERYLAYAVAHRLETVPGAVAEIKRAELQPWPLRAKFYDVTLYWKQDPGRTLIVSIETLSVQPEVWPLLFGTVILNEVVIDHPVFHISGDKQDHATIPQVAPHHGDNNNLIALSVGHFVLTNGEIIYSQQKAPVSANVRGLDIQIHVQDHPKEYRASIAYRDGRLQYASYAPLRHTFAATFSGTPSRLKVESLTTTIGSSNVVLRGGLTDFVHPVFEGEYQARIHAQDFGDNSSSLAIAGDLESHGRVQYKSIARAHWLTNVSIEGRINSESIVGMLPNRRLEFRRVHTRIQLLNGALQVREMGAEVLGGQVGGEFTGEHLDRVPEYRMKATVLGLNLETLKLTLFNHDHQGMALSGVVDGTIYTSWRNRLSEGTTDADLRLHTAENRRPPHLESELPVEGVIVFAYSHPRHSILFKRSFIRADSTEVVVQGEAGYHSHMQIHASTQALDRLVNIISSFYPRFEKALNLSGSAVLDATMQESVRTPRLAGDLSGHNLMIQGTRWSRGNIRFDAHPSEINVRRATLLGENQEQLSLRMGLALHNWSYLPSNSAHLTVLLAQMPLSELQRIVNAPCAISGDLSAELSFDGSMLKPVGKGSVRITNASIFEEPIDSLILNLRADATSINSDVRIHLPAGFVSANVSYVPTNNRYALAINAPAISIQDLNRVRVPGVPLRGMLNVSITGVGTVANPEFKAIVEMPHAQLERASVSQLRAEAHATKQRADFKLSSQMANASLQLHGFVNLTGDQYSEAAFDTGPLQLNDLPGLPLASSNGDSLQGTTEVHATMRGPLKNFSDIEFHATLPSLIARYKSLQLASSAPLHVDCVHSVITLAPAEIHGTGTSLRIGGRLPLEHTSSLSFTANGTLDAELLSLFEPGLKSSGIVSLDVTTTGNVRNPSVQGQVRLRDIALRTAGDSLSIDNLNGSLDVANGRLQVSSLSGQVAGGQLAIAGWLAYWPNAQLQLTFEARGVRFWYARSLMLLLNSDLTLTGTRHSSTLNGTVLIDKLSFTPDFDLKRLAEHVVGFRSSQTSAIMDSVKLAIAVQSKDKLSATTSQASIEGNVNLSLAGTAGRPVILGQTELSSGEVFYAKRRYQLQRSIVVFNDPTENNPALDVLANTKVQQYQLTLRLRGPLDNLTTTYSSDPPLAAADIINLLVVGRTTHTADISGTDSLIASQIAGQFSSKIQTLTGISGLRIDPLIGGSNRNPSARIAVQQRVTKNFLFSFSTDVSQPNGETIEGEYQINKRWSIGATRDPVGGIAVMGRHHTTF